MPPGAIIVISRRQTSANKDRCVKLRWFVFIVVLLAGCSSKQDYRNPPWNAEVPVKRAMQWMPISEKAGAAWGVAREAALKLMETLQIPACAYELEEFIHGPELHLTPNHTLFFLASDPHDRARGAQLSRAASLVTEKTFFFTDDGGDLPVPSSPDALLTPLLFLPFFQLTAYRLTEDLHRWHKHPLVADFESAVSGKSANYVSKEVL